MKRHTKLRRSGPPRRRTRLRAVNPDRRNRRFLRAYDGAPEESLAEVLDRDAEVDAADDPLRLRASRGCVESARRLLDAKLAVKSQTRITIIALRREIAIAEGR